MTLPGRKRQAASALTAPRLRRLTGGRRCGALQAGEGGVPYETNAWCRRSAGGEWLDKATFMRACREGGAAIESALRDLDRSFFPVLYRDGLRALGDHDSACDVVQETFIKVWRRCATFRGESELLPWIKTILRNTMLARLRKPLREVPLDEDPHLTTEVARRLVELSSEGNPTPERMASEQELAELFRVGWARFQELDPHHAHVMAWVVEDGLSIDDLAQLLGRTPGATREFVSQCRKRARTHLAAWYALAVDRSASV
jgi:RNA polymerase sigma factor (sigma-70 family)